MGEVSDYQAVTSKDVQPSEDIIRDTVELNTGKSTVVEEESTTRAYKANIAKEWRNNANYSKNYILGKPDDKMQTRSSLRKQASYGFISQMEPKRMN